MKKIVSLVLALLMLAGLGIAATAAEPLDPADVFAYLYGRQTTALSLSDILSYYSRYAPDSVYYDDLITRWVDECPTPGCKGTALYFVSDGKIRWYCETCEKSGVLDYNVPKADKTPVYKATCPICKSSANLEYILTTELSGSLKDLYYCRKCDEYFYANYGSAYDRYTYSDTIKCPEYVNGKRCGKDAAVEKLFLEDGSLYAKYVCPDGHVNYYEVDDDYYGYNRSYAVSVVASSWGDYAVKGGSGASYGESKTVVFYPKTGYVLTDVLVNGVSVPFADNQVTFKVYGRTTVRPYYTKAADLKPFTITTTVAGSGTVTAQKNAKAVTNGAKVEAKRTDTVVLNFVPSSKNYVVADVKVDGKSVGAVSSYTFTNTGANRSVEVSFRWKSPYADVAKNYLPAVEYVTETGIMGAYSVKGIDTYFNGDVTVTVGTVVNALAELADTKGILNTDKDRQAWAIEVGFAAKGTDFTKTCDVQTACDLAVSYLKAMEKKNAVTFTKLDREASVKDASIKLNLINEKTYNGNRALIRYDLAAICVLISNLEYKG